MVSFIDAERGEYGVEPICTVMEFPPSTYYAAKKRDTHPPQRDIDDAVILEAIRTVWEGKGRRKYGARKVWRALRRQGVQVGRGRVERLMRSAGLAGVVASRRRPRTTLPGDPADRPKDLVDRDFRAPAPNQLWVTDLTYVPLAGGGFCYTALVTDAFSRAIAGWQVGDTLAAELALDALEMALWSRRQKLSAALVHHSDRGVQYTAIRYARRLTEAGIARSVGRKGDSYDNSLAESVNALYKKELIDDRSWNTAAEVAAATADWIWWYNNERLHSWCDYRPPLEFEALFWQDRPQQPPLAA
jgi:putative transposase